MRRRQLAPTLDLLVRQRRDRDEAVLLLQLLIQPVEVLVPPRHLDVVELEVKW
jgi:hypothetical protein